MLAREGMCSDAQWHITCSPEGYGGKKDRQTDRNKERNKEAKKEDLSKITKAVTKVVVDAEPAGG